MQRVAWLLVARRAGCTRGAPRPQGPPRTRVRRACGPRGLRPPVPVTVGRHVVALIVELGRKSTGRKDRSSADGEAEGPQQPLWESAWNRDPESGERSGPEPGCRHLPDPCPVLGPVLQ